MRFVSGTTLLLLVVLATGQGCAGPSIDPATLNCTLTYEADLGLVPRAQKGEVLVRTRDAVEARLRHAGFERFVALVDLPRRIIVRHDHAEHPRRLKLLIGTHGVVGFHLVSEDMPRNAASQLRDAASRRDRALREWMKGHDPLSPSPLEQPRPVPPEQLALRHRRNSDWVVVEAAPAFMVSGERLERVSVVTDGVGDPALELTFDEQGGAQLARLTEENVGRRLAICLDEEALLVVSVYGQLHEDVLLTGLFTDGELADLATVLEAGRLPVPLEFVSETH